MINRTRIRNFIIFAIIFILILVLLIFLYYKFGEKPIDGPIVDETAPVEKVEQKAKEDSLLKLPPPTVKEKQEVAIKALAKSFVERFGSYSSHSDYKNFDELFPHMTNSMVSWIKSTYVPKLQADHPAGGYFYKVETLAPVAKVLEQNDATMKLQLSAQRESMEGTQETRFQQDIILDLVKQGDEWLVDAAYWQEK
jgi:hypothetical protein